jgi:hypothetical protein
MTYWNADSILAVTLAVIMGAIMVTIFIVLLLVMCGVMKDCRRSREYSDVMMSVQYERVSLET